MIEYKNFYIILNNINRLAMDFNHYLVIGAFYDDNIQKKTEFKIEKNSLDFIFGNLKVKNYTNKDFIIEIDLSEINKENIKYAWEYPHKSETDIFKIIEYYNLRKEKQEYIINDKKIKISMEIDNNILRLSNTSIDKKDNDNTKKEKKEHSLDLLELTDDIMLNFHECNMIETLHKLLKVKGSVDIKVSDTNIPGHAIYIPVILAEADGILIEFEYFRILTVRLDMDKYKNCQIVSNTGNKVTFKEIIDKNDAWKYEFKWLTCNIAKDCLHYFSNRNGISRYILGYTL